MTGMCPACYHQVSAHVDSGCTDCGCGDDYGDAAEAAREKGMGGVRYAAGLKFEVEPLCRDCGRSFGECDCDE